MKKHFDRLKRLHPKNKKPQDKLGVFKIKRVHRPFLTPSFPGTTFGAEELNFRVRDGIGCFLFANNTPKTGYILTNRLNLISCLALYTLFGVSYASSFSNVFNIHKTEPDKMRTHVIKKKQNDKLVLVSSKYYYSYTPNLSNS